MMKYLYSFLLCAGCTALLALTKNEQALMAAVQEGNPAKVKSALKKLSARSDRISAREDLGMGESGPTALEVAVTKGDIEIAKLLIAAKANLQERTQDGGCILDLTIPGYAENLTEKQVAMFRFLLQAGLDLNSCERTWSTGTYSLLEKKSIPLVRLLIDAGFKLTPPEDILWRAVQNENEELVELLIDKKFDLKANLSFRFHHNENKSALDVAKDKKNEKLIRLLKAAGAK